MTYTDRDHLERSREYQVLYDDAMREVGVPIPAPVLGQTANEYRRKTLHALQQATIPRNHPLHEVNFYDLQSDALQVIEPQLLQASKAERTNPANVPLGQLKPIKVFDPYGHVTMTKFIGQESFVKQMGRAGRRVVAFMRPLTDTIQMFNSPRGK